MSDGKSSGDDKPQAGGPARATAAVGTAAVGRAVVPGESEATPSAPTGGKPAGSSSTNGLSTAPASGQQQSRPAGGSTPAAPAGGSSSPSGSAGSGATPPKSPTAPSISGSLRPSVVASPAAPPQAPPATSVPPVPPPLNSSLRAVSTPTAPTAKATPPQAPVSNTPPPSSAPPAAGRPTGSATPPGHQRHSGAIPSATAGRTSVMGVAAPGQATNVGSASVGSASVGSASVGSASVGAATTAPPTARTQVGEAVRNVRATVAAAASRGPRRARLQLKKIDPWSVMKFSFAASLVLFIVSVVATALLYTVLDALGVFESLNKTIGQLTASTDQANATSDDFVITAKLVIGSAALLGAVNMVLFTALATLGAFVYNVCADLVGGIEVTLAERD